MHGHRRSHIPVVMNARSHSCIASSMPGSGRTGNPEISSWFQNVKSTSDFSPGERGSGDRVPMWCFTYNIFVWSWVNRRHDAILEGVILGLPGFRVPLCRHDNAYPEKILIIGLNCVTERLWMVNALMEISFPGYSESSGKIASALKITRFADVWNSHIRECNTKRSQSPDKTGIYTVLGRSCKRSLIRSNKRRGINRKLS